MSSTTSAVPEIGSIEPNRHGYRTFTLGSFSFSRDEYFADVRWPKGHHWLPVDAFLRALQRDIAWGFFYGVVNFDRTFYEELSAHWHVVRKTAYAAVLERNR